MYIDVVIEIELRELLEIDTRIIKRVLDVKRIIREEGRESVIRIRRNG